LWIPSYAQKVLDNNSISLTLNEIQYFILQDTKEHFFETEDSLITINYNICQKQLSNDTLIIRDQNIIIDSQSVFIKDQDEFLKSNVREIRNLEKKNKIKTKLIITETFIIIGIILFNIII